MNDYMTEMVGRETDGKDKRENKGEKESLHDAGHAMDEERC